MSPMWELEVERCVKPAYSSRDGNVFSSFVEFVGAEKSADELKPRNDEYVYVFATLLKEIMNSKHLVKIIVLWPVHILRISIM